MTPSIASPSSFLCAVSLFVLGSGGCAASHVTSPSSLLPPPGTHQAMLVSPDANAGSGGVSVTPVANPGHFFDATIRIRLVGARASTTYIVQRAPEIGRPMSSDGACQRALGLSPWSSADAPAPSFLTFMTPGTTAPVTVVTSATGDASLDFAFQAPMIPAGTRFDVQFRLLDEATLTSSLYLSSCFTVSVL